MKGHLSFVDMGGHGYAIVRATSNVFETEFVCIPRPIERRSAPHGGQLLYRAKCRASLWRKRETPKVETPILEGDPRVSV
jgi:alkaline phosphatase D